MREHYSHLLTEIKTKKRTVLLGAIGASMMIHSGLVVKEKTPTPPNVNPVIAGPLEAFMGAVLLADMIVTFSDPSSTPTAKRRK